MSQHPGRGLLLAVLCFPTALQPSPRLGSTLPKGGWHEHSRSTKVGSTCTFGRVLCRCLLAILLTFAFHQTMQSPIVVAQTAAPAESKTSPGSLNYFRFSDIGEMIRGWKPNQHLYVKGDLGLSPAELMELEGWLHKRGHWTAILMQSASDQRYVNTDGRVEVGMDAVELSMSDLMEVGSYRDQTNSITGEQDAAVFILFLKERKFSYRAAEAFSRRGLGQNRWIGKLDRPAYRAMRGGGRIIDAVKDTVKSINAPLRNAIEEEQKIAKKRQRQRQRTIDGLSAKLSQVQDKLARIEKYAKDVRDAKPSATADLTAPKIGDIESQLTDLRKTVTASGTNAKTDLSSLKKNVDQIGNASDDWINLYNEYARFGDSEKQLQQRRDQLQTDAGELQPAIDDQLTEVNTMLASARKAWDAADSKFQKHLNSANHALENATTALADERTLVAQKKSRRSLIRRVTMAVTGFLSTILAGLMLWLNRRRGPAKTRAEERLEQRSAEVKKEMEGMGDLMGRADIVIGDRKAIDRKGYQGKTRELSGKVLDDIDDMLVMSNSVEKVMDNAREKITPDSWWQRFMNRWSAKGYDEGFDILENKPIEFGEHDGISIVRDEEDGPIKTQTETTTDGEKKSTIELSFAELFQIFHKRSQRVQNTINEVETGWTNIVSTNNDLQRAIDTASENEQKARALTEQDSLLSVPQLFDDLLKSAQADQDASEVMGKTDPISAIAGPATDGLRKAANADELSRQLIAVRELFFPAIRQGGADLDQRGRAIEWIDAALDDFTARAQTLATEALSQDVSEGIGLWRMSFEKFTAAVTRSVELHDQSVGEVAKAIESATAEVADARKKIAARLSLPEQEILAERDRAADEQIHSASTHNAAAQAALDRGDPPAAELSVAESLQWVNEARQTAAQSLKILDDLPQQNKQLTGPLQTTQKTIASREELLASLEQRFTDSSLLIETAVLDNVPAAADKDSSDVTIYETVSMPANDLLAMAKRKQSAAVKNHENAKTFYEQGRLLEADECYTTATELLQQSDEHLQSLSDHGQALDQSVADNLAKLDRLQSRFDDLENRLNQHHVTRATQETARQMHGKFEEVGRAIRTVSGRRDPSAEAKTIENVDAQFEQFDLLMERDQAMYDEARRSIASLRALLTRAERLSNQSQTDNIPDSGRLRQELSAIGDAQQVVDTLQGRLERAHEDWADVDVQADTALASVTSSVAKLQNELSKAQSAALAIQRASSDYRSAVNWSGSYGIRANPQQVRNTLDQARAALARGDYQAAITGAGQSQNAIANAIRLAENEVLRRQAAERRERERRRRRNNRSISGGSIFGSSGFPGGSRRSSSSSRRSSSPRRSSRSSSSGRGGFSRSGW